MEDETFQVPCKATFEWITPEDAKHMLDAGNRRNRKVTDPGVRRLTGVISRDEWMYDSTDAIGLATDGAVVNGQHRLTAIAEGDQGVWALIVRGVRPEIIKVIDQGIGRTLAQTLEIDGRFTQPSIVASAAEHIYKMINRFERRMPTAHKPTIPQGLELLAAHPHLVDSLELAGKFYTKNKVLPKGVLTAYHYTFSCADADLADGFFDALATGESLSEGDAVLLLRERFNAEAMKDRPKRIEHWQAMHLLVTAWEATRAGHLTPKQTKLLRTGRPLSATTVPTVSDVGWLASEASAERAA